MCLFVALLAGLSGVEAHGEAAPVRILFDGGFALENGVAPVRNEGAGLTEGRSGQAASFSEGAVLAYPAAGGFDPNQGTLSLWVRPDWDSVNAFGDRYFWGITNPDGGARIVLGFLGCYYSLFMMPVGTCSVAINDVRICVAPAPTTGDDQ